VGGCRPLIGTLRMMFPTLSRAWWSIFLSNAK
jgi:hypothetical protein